LQETNEIKKETEKGLKYKDLTQEIQCMWNVNAKVTPVIIGAACTMSLIQKTPSNMAGKHEIWELRKKHIGHCAMLQKVLT